MPLIKANTFSRDSIQNSYQRKVFKRNGKYYLFYADREGGVNKLLYRYAESLTALATASENEATSAENSDYQYGGDYDAYYDREGDRVAVIWLKKSVDKKRRFLFGKLGTFASDGAIQWGVENLVAGGDDSEFKDPVLAKSPAGNWGVCAWRDNSVVYYGSYSNTLSAMGNWSDAANMISEVGSSFSDHRVCGVGKTGDDILVICRSGKDIMARRWNGSAMGGEKRIAAAIESEERMSGAVADTNGNVHLLTFSEKGGNHIKHVVYDAEKDDWQPLAEFESPAGEHTQHISLTIDCNGGLHAFFKLNVHKTGQEDAETLFYFNNVDGTWADKTGTLPDDFKHDFWDFRDSPVASRNAIGELLVAWINVTRDEQNELWMSGVPMANFSAPKADIESNPETGAAPLTVQFRDASTAGSSAIVSRKWDFGDGSTSHEKDPEHTYNTHGEYTVSLTVTDNCELSDNAEKRITATKPPKPTPPKSNFDFEFDAGGCHPIKVKFQDASQNGSDPITTWQWDFGDGNASEAQHPTHAYQTHGDFTVTLTVKDENDREHSLQKSLTIPKYKEATPEFTNQPPGGKMPLTVEFTDVSRPGSHEIVSREWDFGDGNKSNVAENPVIHTYNAAGRFSVTLTITDQCGTSKLIKKENAVVVEPPVEIGDPTADFTCEPDSGVGPVEISFTDTSQPAADDQLITTWAWDFGDGGSSREQHPRHTYAEVDERKTYNVTLTVTDSAGKTHSTTKPCVVVNPQPLEPPTADFTCEPNDGIGPLEVSFSDTSQPAKADQPITTWAWDFGDGNSSREQNPKHTYAEVSKEKTYNVALTVTDSKGKTDSTTKSCVNVKPKPVEPPPDECEGLGLKCMLCYLFFWISGILCWVFGKNRCIKFHGMQSFLCFFILDVIILIAWALAASAEVIWVLCAIVIIIWLICIFKSIKCKIFKLPIIGEICYRQIFGKE